MKSFRRVATYAHGIEDVWTALTDPYALAEWLMPTTFFEPIVGSKFRFQFDPDRLSPSGIVDCEVIEVEPHEAEWCLEVIEELFEHFYVGPETAKAKKAALNAKLAAGGKPPAK